MLNAFTSNWFLFFPLAFGLYVALRFAEGSVDREHSSPSVLLARLLIATLFGFALLAVGLRENPLGFFWFLLAAGAGCILLWKSRKLDRSALLLSAMQAASESQQLTLCEAYWFENRGWIRRQSAALRRDLIAGTSWWQAIEKRKIARGVYEKLAVRLVARYGSPKRSDQTQPMQRAAYAILTPLQIETEVEQLLGRLLLFVWLLVALPTVVFIAVFILPTMKDLFQEFDAPIPPLMLSFMELADSAMAFGWGALLFLLPMGLAGVLSVAWLVWLFPHWMERFPLRWLGRDYYRNAGFTGLAYALEHESDLATACRVTSRLVALESLARPYDHVAELLQAGMEPHAAFHKAGLINQREHRALCSNFRQGNPSWALRQFSIWKTNRMLRRYSILVQLAVVLLTLFLALIVGIIAIALFQTLSAMAMSIR